MGEYTLTELNVRGLGLRGSGLQGLLEIKDTHRHRALR